MGQKAAAGKAPRKWLCGSGGRSGGGALRFRKEEGERRKEEVPVHLGKSSLRNYQEKSLVLSLFLWMDSRGANNPTAVANNPTAVDNNPKVCVGLQKSHCLALCLQPLIVRAGTQLDACKTIPASQK